MKKLFLIVFIFVDALSSWFYGLLQSYHMKMCLQQEQVFTAGAAF